jgi:hypothetical protein
MAMAATTKTGPNDTSGVIWTLGVSFFVIFTRKLMISISLVQNHLQLPRQMIHSRPIRFSMYAHHDSFATLPSLTSVPQQEVPKLNGTIKMGTI